MKNTKADPSVVPAKGISNAVSIGSMLRILEFNGFYKFHHLDETAAQASLNYLSTLAVLQLDAILTNPMSSTVLRR